MNRKGFKTMALSIALILCFAMTAFGALTLSITRNIGTADSLERIRDFTVTFDSSYATGGEAFVASDIGISSIYSMACTNVVSGMIAIYNFSSSIKVFQIISPPQEATAASDLALFVFRCRATGK